MNCWPSFGFHPVDRQVLNNWPLYVASPFSRDARVCSLKPRQPSFGYIKRQPAAIWHEQVTGHALQVWSLPFGYFGEVKIVHVIQGLNTSAVQRVVTWMPRAFEPYHESCMNCGCIMSTTSSPWVPISCVLAFSSLQVGLARCVLRLM